MAAIGVGLGAGLRRTAFAVSQLFGAATPGAYLEAQNPDSLLKRRNRLTYSSQFSNAAWTRTNILSITDAADGVGDLVVPNTTAGPHYLSQTNASPGRPNAIVVRAKAGGYNYLCVQLGFTGAAYFNLATGAVGTVTAGYTASISAVPGLPGYYDCVASSDTTPTNQCFIFATSTDGNVSFAADGVSGIYLARAHLEWNTLTPTAYQEVTDWTTEYLAAVGERIAQWSDSNGTTPVLKVEDPDGLWLDTKTGAGPELVTNGGFVGVADGTAITGVSAQWSLYGAPTTAEVRGERLYLASSAANMGAKLTVPTEAGATYCFVSAYQGDGAPDIYIANDISGSGGIVGTPTGRAVFKATSAATTFFFRVNGNTAGSGYFDNITIRKLPGNHATQATSPSRPVLSARYNLATATEAVSNTAPWLAANYTIESNSLPCPKGPRYLAKVTWQPTSSIAAYQFTAPAGPFRVSFFFAAGNRPSLSFLIRNVTTSTNLLASNYDAASGSIVSGVWVIEAVGAGIYRASVDVTSGFAAGDSMYAYWGNTGNAFSAGDYWYVGGMDIRTTSDAALNMPSYQRVNTATDYDTEGFPHYEALDGTDDGIGITSTAGFLGANMDVFILSTRRSAGNAVALSNDVTGTSFLGVMASGDASLSTSGAGGTWKTFVNGVQVGGTATTTRDQLHAAFPAGSTKLLEFQNVDLSTWAKLVRGSYTGFMLNSRDYAILVCPAQSDATRARIRRYLANKVGMTL